MTSEERTRELGLALLGEVCAEDVDFLTGNKPRSRRHSDGRKAKQLCRQVADTLDLVLSGDCRDERLQALHVLSVVPAPNSSRLLVTVSVDLPSEEFDRQAILELLERQTGRLRGEVAASINRKRVPALVFHLVGPSLESSRYAEGLGRRSPWFEPSDQGHFFQTGHSRRRNVGQQRRYLRAAMDEKGSIGLLCSLLVVIYTAPRQSTLEYAHALGCQIRPA